MESDQPRRPGRPENKVPAKEVDITTMDPVTFKMLDALVAYGRFGRSTQEVALYIIRAWLWDNEQRLKAAIGAKSSPLGYQDSDSDN